MTVNHQAMLLHLLRFCSCAALLALLAVSSYTAREPIQAPAAAVLIETVSSEVVSTLSMADTQQRLETQRKEALVLLEGILQDPASDEASKKRALLEKTKIASRMEMEASLGALLSHMGFGETAVIMGEGQISIIAPWQAAENEQSRVRMIDAAVSQSGLSADAVKIILSKK